MTFAEVDELNKRIDLFALHGYSLAVQKRTRAIVATLAPQEIDEDMEEKRLRQIRVAEGLTHSQAAGFIQNYLGWSKGKCLMTFGLTHSWQHVGEMEVIAGLLVIEFEQGVRTAQPRANLTRLSLRVKSRLNWCTRKWSIPWSTPSASPGPRCPVSSLPMDRRWTGGRRPRDHGLTTGPDRYFVRP